MKLKQTILIVDDEAPIRDMIRMRLESNHYRVIEAESSKQALVQLSQRFPDLILLDWMMPGESGIDFLKKLKQDDSTRDIPIIMLTAKAEEDNRVKGFDVGADDYVVKPFSLRELMARIKAVLKRSTGSDEQHVVQVSALQINLQSQVASAHGQTLKLTPIEYRLLAFFMTHQNRVYTRSQLLDQVWGQDTFIDDRTVDVQIRRLRSVLKKSQLEHLIQTVRGSGYRFSSEIN